MPWANELKMFASPVSTCLNQAKRSWPGEEMLGILLPKIPKAKNPIMHSDMGRQYQHEAYCTALREAGVVQSMSRKGNCLDNGATKRLFGRMKDEFFRGQSFESFEELKEKLEEYIVHWNTSRRQVRLKGLTPEEFRASP